MYKNDFYKLLKTEKYQKKGTNNEHPS